MERARKNNPQVLLILLAAAFAVAAIWAATALAAGGSSGRFGRLGRQPAGGGVRPGRERRGDHPPSADDCPDRADGSGSGSGDSSGSTGSDSTDF